MTAKTVNKLAVPGATLHYEVTGTGPMLLLIAGGFTDSGVFDAIVGQLAADYTVVAYDPRGNSRSPYDGPAVAEHVDRAADDALALIDEVAGDQPAFVFGSSSGAVTGLVPSGSIQLAWTRPSGAAEAQQERCITTS